MNWEKYKQKYFFEGVNNFDEINKALLFNSDYAHIAELFHKITTNIIQSRDYSDKNIDQNCCDAFDSITDDPSLKAKFQNAWSSFNETLGIGVKNLKKSVWNSDDAISNLLPQFNKVGEKATLSVEEYGLAGHYIISTLTQKLGFPFEMAVEISCILLADYTIKLPKKQPPIDNYKKKWSQLYQSILDSKVLPKSKSITFYHDVNKNESSFHPDPINKKRFLRSKKAKQVSAKLKSNIPMTISIDHSIKPSTRLVLPKANNATEDTRNESISNVSKSILNRLILNHNRSEFISSNSILPIAHSISEQMLALRADKLSILLNSNEITLNQYNECKDQLDRLEFLDAIPKHAVIHDNFERISESDQRDKKLDLISESDKRLSEYYGSSTSNSLELESRKSSCSVANVVKSSSGLINQSEYNSIPKVNSLAATEASVEAPVKPKWCSLCVPSSHKSNKK